MAPGIIQIFVKGLQGGTTAIDIHKDATVKEFLALLSKTNGIPEEAQRVIYAGKQLDPASDKRPRLNDYGLQHGSTVFLVLRLKGGTDIPPEKVLDDAVELSDAPDMITWDDDPENKRAKMPCGHAITPESLTIYCRSILDAGRSRFLCPYISQDQQPPVYCGVEWDYIDVRRLAVLTEGEIREFEKKISQNYLIKAMGIQECPSCNSMVERVNKKHIRVVCPVCSKNKNTPFEFCWHCLHEWTDGTCSSTKCGNSDCSGEDKRLKILRDCPRKTIVGVVGCPSLRACLACGMLIEHVRACKHMRCRCGKEFCFICLKPKEGTSWTCGRYNEACTMAPVQTKIPGDN